MKLWGKLSEDWNTVDDIIIYGFGNMAQIYMDNLYKMIKIRFIIDNSPDLEGKKFNDIPIYTYKEAQTLVQGNKIVIIAETVSYEQIRNMLIEDGYIENIDFAGLERFVCEYFLKNRRQACVMEVHTAVTTYCTLNCMKCNMFMPYYKNRSHLSLEQLKRNIDLLMFHIDYVFKYQILGGEPLLNKDLASFLLYLSSKYGERIGRIRIVSNGSICPDDELIYALKRANAEVNISDYTNIVDYKDKMDKSIEIMKKEKINYSVIPALRWRDFGFPQKSYNRPVKDIREHMLKCGTAWHGLVDGKLYYCNCAWSANKTGMYEQKAFDYLNLDSLEDGLDGQIKILELCLADFEPGYNGFCQFCGGCGSDNERLVTAGIQVKL